MSINQSNNSHKTKEKLLANQAARQNTEISQVEIDKNKVRSALENLATTSNNKSKYDNITKTQVLRYHQIALTYLLQTQSGEKHILDKALEIDSVRPFLLKFENVRLSENFFSKPLKDHLTTVFGTYNHHAKPLTGHWKKLYKLSNLIKHIKKVTNNQNQKNTNNEHNPNNSRSNLYPPQGFNFEGTGPENAQTYLTPLRDHHERTMGFHTLTSMVPTFTVDVRKHSNKTLIVIRYNTPLLGDAFTSTPQKRYIEWVYIPGDELEYAVTFIGKLPRTVKLDINKVSFFEHNEDMVTNVIGMLTNGLHHSEVREAMRNAKFPPRLWLINELKLKANNNAGKIKNIGSSFSNSKLERIETFLSNVNDLFTLIANGRHNSHPKAIGELIDAFALKQIMYAVKTQRLAVNKIIQPQQGKDAYRQNLLSKESYNNEDRKIISFSIDVHDTVALLPGSECVGIRDLRNTDFGIVIKKSVNGAFLKERFTKQEFEKFVKRKAFQPKDFEKGDLHKAVTEIVSFCIWNGQPYPHKPNVNWLMWWQTGQHLREDVARYKLFTIRKIAYLTDILPKHFELKTLLREFLKLSNDDAYKWVLTLSLNGTF